jgi:hypothetical protein
VFDGLKRRWAEARVGPVSDYVADILQQFERLDLLDRYAVSSAFNSALLEMEDRIGPFAGWTAVQKREVARIVMRASRAAGATRGSNMEAETTRIGASGGTLLSFYLELQTMPGNRAIELVKTIDEWRQTASS